MAKQINQDDFEAFLQNELKNQRMYPSDAVWRNISKEMHGEKKWPALTVAAFSLLIATVGISLYFAPKPNIFTTDHVITTSQNRNLNTPDEPANLTAAAPYFIEKNNEPVLPGSLGKPSSSQADFIAEPITVSSIDGNVNNNTPQKNNAADLLVTLSTAKSIKAENIRRIDALTGNIINQSIVVLPENEKELLKIADNKTASQETKKKETPDPSDKNIADKFLQEHAADIALFTASKRNSLKNKLSFQVYITPSASFRKLSENPALASINDHSGGGPLAVNYVADVNKIVRHTPGVGIEAGANILYNITDKFRVKGGLQFNIRQYNIEAFNGNAELATIALIHNSIVDSVNSIAVYRTSNGYSSANLVNRYYQLSLPVGVEYQILGNDFIQLNVAASVQPTYLLNRNAYALSTNFKNYTSTSNMIRHWNVNSSIEAFITIKSGDFKWQLGPQFRYQHMPTFITAYPINEHLMDYGLKLGFSKVIK